MSPGGGGLSGVSGGGGNISGFGLGTPESGLS